MIILGIDPGTLNTGYGIIEFSNGKISLIASGIIENKRIKSLPLRLKFIYDEISKLIDQYLPDELSIESAFYGKNVQSALKIGHARGVSILAAINKQLPTYEYTPREIKKSIVGNGAASKQQVMFMVNQILQLRKRKTKFDETDAIAVALCHLQKMIRPDKKHKNWKSFVTENPHLVVG